MGRTRRLRRRKLQTNPRPAGDISPEIKLIKLLSTQGWRNDAQLSSRDFTGTTGRGLLTKRGIEEDSLIIQLPFTSLITLCTLQMDSKFREFFCSSPQMNHLKTDKVTAQCLLSLYLVFYKHSCNSELDVYMETIPKIFTNPYFCQRNELYHLPENILCKIVEQNEIIKRNYECFRKTFENLQCPGCNLDYFPEILKEDEFKWAYFAVNTRCVHIDLEFLRNNNGFQKTNFDFRDILSDQFNMGLAPFLDLLNHSDKARTESKLAKISNESLRTTSTSCNDQNLKSNKFMYELYSKTPYPKYEQVFINYGNYPNLKLLIEYGFFIENNCNDLFEFSLDDIELVIKRSKNTSIHRNKFKFIRDHNLDDQMFIDHRDGLSHNLKVVLFILFKEKSHFPNVLNQVAFGSSEIFDNDTSTEEEGKLLVEEKLKEYENYKKDLENLNINGTKSISESAFMCLNYIEECIKYLKRCLNKSFC